MPAFNFIANANAVSYLGGIPHFVDIEKESLGIDPIKLEHYLLGILKKKEENILIRILVEKLRF